MLILETVIVACTFIQSSFPANKGLPRLHLDKSPLPPSLRHDTQVLLRLEPTDTVLTTNTDSAPFEVICDVFCRATRLPRVLFKERLGTLLALTSSRGRCAALPLQTPPMDRYFR